MNRRAKSLARAESCPAGHARSSLQPTSLPARSSHASSGTAAASRRLVRATDPGAANTRTRGPCTGPNVPVSPPSHRRIRSQIPSPNGDSRARRRHPSRTTPAAPAAVQPAATLGPMPPRIQVGRLVCASNSWRRMNEEESEPNPPASWPAPIKPSTPACSASAAESLERTSASESRSNSWAAFAKATQLTLAASLPMTAARLGGHSASHSRMSARPDTRTAKGELTYLATLRDCSRMIAESASSEKSRTPRPPARQAATTKATPSRPTGDRAKILGSC